MKPGKKLAFAVAILALSACQKAPQMPDHIRPVRLQVVEPGPVQPESRYAGEIVPRYESNLGFRVAGKILRREVNIGQAVRAGQVLARLDPRDLSLNADSAKANVAAQQAQYAIDQADLARYRTLLDQGFIGRADFERQQAKAEASHAQLQALQAQLAVSANQAAYAALKADHDGTIAGIQAENGQVVAAGQTVVQLAWSGDKEVAASVPEGMVTRLQIGMPVRVALWSAPGQDYAAHIREIASSADPSTRTYAVRVAVPEAPAAMKLGMTAVLIVPLSGGGDLIHLPFASITQRDGKAGVWVYDAQAGVVHFRVVELGGVADNDVLVRGGLQAGETVVTAGAAFLRPEQKVKPLEQSPPAVSAAAG